MSNGLDCMYKVHKDYLKGIKYDILLIDENMPVMGGTVCINNLKLMISAKELNNIDIISITSYQDDIIRKRMFALGCSEIFSKPIKYKDLEKYVIDYANKSD